jgi:GTPase
VTDFVAMVVILDHPGEIRPGYTCVSPNFGIFRTIFASF